MRGRFGNGMFLWLGGALIAHAALLVLPGAPADQAALRQGGLQVRIASPGHAVPTTAEGIATAQTTLEPPEPAPVAVREPAPLVTRANATPARPAPANGTGLESVALETARNPLEATGDRKPARLALVETLRPAGRATVSQTAHETVASETTAPPVSVPDQRKPLQLETGEAVAPPTEPERADHVMARNSVTLRDQPRRDATLASGAALEESEARPSAYPHARLLELTDRLHRAIEREKRYPLSARRLGREGTASVAFQLRPDGAIDAIQVAASSGEPALDRAALRAVQGISPFGSAGDYLDESTPFRVDIAFRLR